MRRQWLRLVILLLSMAISLAAPMSSAPAPALAEGCELYRITSYAASDYPGWTADGSTTTWNALERGELIAAASYNVPFGSYVEVPGATEDGGGTYRVADRGHLGARHIDVLVSTRWEALQIGSSLRPVCVTAPGES